MINNPNQKMATPDHFVLTEEIKDRLINTSHDLICIAGMDGYFKYVNPAWKKTLGYTKKELLSRPFLDFIHPDDHKINDAEVAKLSQGLVTIDFENRYIHKNGSVRTISWTATSLEEENHMYCIGRDITKRKNAEASLEADLKSMHNLLQIGKLFLREYNLEETLDKIVEAAITITQADKGNLQIMDSLSGNLKIVAQRGFNQKWVDFWDSIGKGQGACGKAFDKCKRVIVEDITTSPVFADTTVLEVQLSEGVRSVQSTPLMSKEGKILGVFSTHYSKPHQPDKRHLRLLDLLAGQTADIIERNQAEKALRESELKFRALIENSTDVISLLDKNGFVLYNSPSYTRTMGYPVKKRIGHYTFDLVHPDDRNKFLSLFAGIIKKPGKVRMPSVRVLHNNGSWLWIEGIANNLLNESSVNAIVVNYHDITERKHAEEALLKSEMEKSVILNTMSELVVYQDLDHNILWTNHAAARSVNSTVDDLKERKCHEIWTGRKEECESCPVARAIKTGKIQQEEITTPDGRTWSIKGYPVRNETGKISGGIEVTLDITDRKRAEEDIRTSEICYRELFDHINSGVAVYEAINNGADFIFRDFNQAGQRIDKINKNKVIGKSVLQMFPAIKEFGLFDVFQRVWKTGTSEILPVTNYKDNRITGWRENYVYKLPTGDIVAVYNDITEQKQAEKKLIDSEEKYRTLFNNASEAIFVVQDGMLVFCNPMTIKITGYSSKDLGSRLFTDFIHADDQKMVYNLHLKRLKGEKLPEVYSFRIVNREGHPIWIELRSVLIRWEDRDATLNFASNITKRKLAENALLESEDKFKYIFDHSIVGKSITFPSGEIHVNQAFCNMLGYSWKELQGLKWQDITHPDEVELTQKEVDAMLSGDKESARFMKRYIHKNGSTVWVDISTSLRRDPEGNPLYFITMVSDITAQKHAQEQIQNSLKEKEILLRELYHRTKNNMQVISSMLRLEARYLKNQQVKNIFREIENKILSMALVHKKLYESQDLSHINLKEYIEGLVQLFRNNYSSSIKGIKISVYGENINVLLDTAMPCGLIINELITNAMKYAFPDKRKGNIDITLNLNPKNEIVLKISDNGVGLPENFDIRKEGGLGIQTIIELVEYQLEGNVNFKYTNGFRCTIVLKKELYKPRV